MRDWEPPGEERDSLRFTLEAIALGALMLCALGVPLVAAIDKLFKDDDPPCAATVAAESVRPHVKIDTRSPVRFRAGADGL